ncbi:hypothetical protein LS482_05525 [Sinomicrobium kalidii]|uniref:coiled-coil domain-containing protein n=1 Tax=Sinomicrobium kalidii TaxID=2900738 RepID=UPI001E5C8093|nr:hypothetical protein [Sinomicrobium kalidii]UGU17330.1 hypothetical protein LS482_05525 [Sinomicrobium kalidii]
MRHNVLCLFFLMSSVFVFADCTTLYSSITYAFSHSGKSLEANNFDHQRYYAKRSLQALEKAEEQMESCDCTKINNIMYDVRESLEKAIDPEDWDTGRFYVKKAREYLSETITTLDRCTADTDPVPASAPDEAKEDDYSDKKVAGEDKKVTLAEKQEALKKEQEALIAKQKALERQLDEQRRIEQQLAEARQKELEAQKTLKVKAEIELYKMESAAMELINAFSCGEFVIKETYKRGEEVLQEESLEETRHFYREKLREIVKKMTDELDNCSGK